MGYAQKIREAHETLTLPSGYHVTMRLGLSIDEQGALPEGLSGIEAGKAAIVAMIESWDLDDEAGGILPINDATVGGLGAADATALGTWIKTQGDNGWMGTPEAQRDLSRPSAGGSAA